MAGKKFNVLPGFGLTMGFTMFYLSVIVLIPIVGLFFRASEAGWRSQDFTSRDFKDVGSLVARLKTPEDPVSQFLWGKFSESARQTLYAYEPGAANDAEAERVLSAELNQLLSGGSLQGESAFAEVNLSPEAQRLIDRGLRGGRTVRMNRLLLEASYADALEHRESWYDFWHLATSPRALAAYRLTFGASFLAAIANVIFGTL